ncbi:MAG: hypothetical protein AAGL89_09285 [Pseudomonadota bacterium]
MMLPQDMYEACVARAALAPTVHNTQPARWVRDGEVLSLFCDTDVGLSVGDPTGRDAALSCGAVLEAMVLALSAEGYQAQVTYTGAGCRPGQGLVPVAHVALETGAEDGLHAQLEARFTWRGPFTAGSAALFGWTRKDTRLVLDEPGRRWLAERNDTASLAIMQDANFRQELVSWMRLRASHPRAGLDGMDRDAMRMSAGQARLAPFVLTKLWGLLDRIGITPTLTTEQDVTLTAPVIGLFYRPKSENPVESGRAYLRLCLEATSLGFAGWPMAALSDHVPTCEEICKRFGIPLDQRLVQVIRFGVPTGDAPARARRPLSEVLR